MSNAPSNAREQCHSAMARTDGRTDGLTETRRHLPEDTSPQVTRTRTYGDLPNPEGDPVSDTKPDLDAIEARANLATSGPWVSAEARSEHPRYDVTSEAIELEDQDSTIADRVLDYTDAEFIAHAREDVPALVAYARTLEAENESLRGDRLVITWDAAEAQVDADEAYRRMEARHGAVGAQLDHALARAEAADELVRDLRDVNARLVQQLGDAEAENERLRGWKSGAMEVMRGLEDIGRALDLPLGERITGPAALERIKDMTAKMETLQRGAQTLGRILDDSLKMALDASGRHDVIDDDGDGDWEIVWETLASLRPRAEAAEAERDLIGDTLARRSAAHDRLAHRLDQIRAALADFRDHGLRADLNPTMPMRDAGSVYTAMSAYMRRLDTSVRDRASRALDGDQTEEAP